MGEAFHAAGVHGANLGSAREALRVEVERREYAETLAEATMELCAAYGEASVVRVLTGSFLRVFGAADVLILQGRRGEDLKVLACSSPLFQGVEWPWDEFTERVTEDGLVVVGQSEQLPGWRAQLPEVIQAIGSSMHCTLQAYEVVTQLVCVHSEHDRFDEVSRERAERLLPTLVEAWRAGRLAESEVQLRESAERVNQELRRTQQQLVGARDEAEAASVAKSTFLARMSHELRTPLGGVIGLTELALRTKLSDDAREYIDSARSSAEHLLQVLNDILDLSKVEAGKMTLERIPFDLSKLLNEVERFGAVQAEEKGLDFRCVLDLGGHSALRIGDPLRIKQVLLNLINNATKFTERGSIVLQVTAEDARTLHMEVIDTGIGIDPKTAKGLFDPFRQAEESTARRYGGTGLGLAICRQLVEAHLGQIWCEGEPGIGSTFHVLLAMDVAESLPGAQPNEEVAVALEGLRVLIAEDNAVNQLVARRMLEGLGHDVEVADNGQEAIVKASEGEFDLILMDMQMPVVDGLEATAVLRELLGHELPILALTANAMSGDRERCLEAGMTGYLTKPLRERELVAALERYLVA